MTEDIKIQNDDTVRDSFGKIYQFAYGEDNLDPCQTIKVGNDQEICDISRLADKLNLEYSLGML